MLVIAIATGARWSGRRHDDDAAGASRGDSETGLFEAVFDALHDGEQVAVGFPAPLSVSSETSGVAADNADAAVSALAKAEADSPTVHHVQTLVTELGRWRPWTIVSTSLPRWRATTSVLIFEIDAPVDADAGQLDRAVDGLFDLVRARADHGAEVGAGQLVNLAAAAARKAGLTVDAAQLDEPVVLVAGADRDATT